MFNGRTVRKKEVLIWQDGGTIANGYGGRIEDPLNDSTHLDSLEPCLCGHKAQPAVLYPTHTHRDTHTARGMDKRV